jgi:hypothetical protein
MAFAIKAGILDSRAKTFAFTAQKTMYGGKRHHHAGKNGWPEAGRACQAGTAGNQSS